MNEFDVVRVNKFFSREIAQIIEKVAQYGAKDVITWCLTLELALLSFPLA